MNMKKAMAAVLDKFPDAGARTHAALFLERYSGYSASPFTAWNAYGEEADAVRTVLAELGMTADADWKETLSSLDPKAVRFHWTAAGAAKLAALPNWSGAETRRRLVLRLGDPLEDVPDEPASGEPGQTSADRPGLIAEILERTAEIARKVPAMLECSNPPIAPLWAMERAARSDGVDWLPELELFAQPENCMNAAWVAARPLRTDETHLPAVADRIGFLPLPEQVGPESPSDSPVNGYLAYTADELANVVGDPRGEIDGMWVQFQAYLRAFGPGDPDGIGVLQYATDGRKMAQLVTRLVEYSYPGLSCGMIPTTHVAVHNDCSDVRSNSADDEGYLRERFDNSTIGSNSVCYVGGFELSRGGHAQLGDEWGAAKPLVVSAGDAPVDETVVATMALTTEELGAEWFMMVHQNRSFETVAPGGALVAFRRRVQNLRENPAAMADLCSPHNSAYALRPPDNSSTPHGALVNGVCAAIRKVALGSRTLAFVNDSPFEPDNFVSAVWSGIETDLAPDDLAEAERGSVFPKVGEIPFDATPDDFASVEAGARRTTDLLMLLRRRPDIQLGFARRTDRSHRSRVVVIETNVDAKQFLALHPDSTFDMGLRKQFVTSFVARSGNPLSSVTWADDLTAGVTRVPLPMRGFYPAVQQAYADIDPHAAERICNGLLSGYYTGQNPKVGVGFLVDAIGRLIVVIRTLDGPLVERMHLAWRHCEGLPLVPAATLKRANCLPGIVVIDKTVSAASRRAIYLRGMAKQAQRWEDSADVHTLSSAYGRTAFVYAFQESLSGWDCDAGLPGPWYTALPLDARTPMPLPRVRMPRG